MCVIRSSTHKRALLNNIIINIIIRCRVGSVPEAGRIGVCPS